MKTTGYTKRSTGFKMKVLDLKRDSEEVKKLCRRGEAEYSAASDAARKILYDVKLRGDAAVFDYTKKFDGFDLNEKNIRVTTKEVDGAFDRVSPETLKALKHAVRNIRFFHKRQFKSIKMKWNTRVEDGIVVGEKTTPIDSVGCYVPGGRATYPSTVLMNCIPAKIAGVPRIVVSSPPPIADTVLSACKLCGVSEVYRMGGAQAIGALAYGTKTVPRVSKIVGPGNKYVAAAKMLVYGTVDVDMPAGPSEVAVIADETANPAFVEKDLLAQAEHDPDAVCVLVTTDPKLPGKIKASGKQFSAVVAGSLEEAVEFTDEFAPEHLEVMTRNPEKVAARIRNAGAVFLGPYAPVAAGDYASGGNHVLPTGGTARFSSPLSVRDFLKTTLVQKINKNGLARLRQTVTALAESEGLVRHKESVEKRFLG
jgi:histidinol dehydrogenase